MGVPEGLAARMPPPWRTLAPLQALPSDLLLHVLAGVPGWVLSQTPLSLTALGSAGSSSLVTAPTFSA